MARAGGPDQKGSPRCRLTLADTRPVRRRWRRTRELFPQGHRSSETVAAWLPFPRSSAERAATTPAGQAVLGSRCSLRASWFINSPASRGLGRLFSRSRRAILGSAGSPIGEVAIQVRPLSRRHSRLSRSILFCRIVVIGLTLALPACTDFKKDFLCRPDGHWVNAQAGHTPT